MHSHLIFLDSVKAILVHCTHRLLSESTLIADNLSKAGWSWGCVAAVDSEGRTIWIADAHRDNGKRFVVHSDEKLTAFLELERAICLRLLTEQL